MAQPTQQFPPWLSPSAFIVTDAAGTPVATETSIVYIPPTYFGPSIPLGTLYSFGGSTEPATVVLPSPTPQTTTTVAPPSTTATPSLTTSLTTTATPTTTVSISSTTAITTSSLTSATSTTSSTSSLTTSATSTSSFTSSVSSSSNTIPNSTLTSTSATNTSTAVGPAAMAGLTKGQLVGVIVASILGLIFLFVLALFLYLWCRGRRNRRGANTLSQGIDDDYYFVPEGAGRIPGEGSPRHSGEEQDPFLQRSSGAGWAAESSTAGGNSMGVAGGAAAAGAVRAADMAQVPSNGSASRRVPPPPTGSNSSQSTGSHASGFGVLLDRPSMSLGLLPITAEHSEHRTSRQLSDSDMARIGRESVLPDELDQYPDEEYTGAYAYSRYSQHPPPRLVGAATATTPLLGEASPHPSFEEPTLLTARRVKAEDLGPRTASQTSAGSPATAVPSPRGSGGFLGALGLGGLGRLSWFRNLDSPRSSGAAEPSHTTEPLLEKDLETGRGLLSPTSAAAAGADSFGARARGAGPDGTRPYSGVSARSGTSVSGGTLYHDAESSVPGTPVLAPLPRAITPAHAHSPSHSQLALSEQAWLAGGPLPASGGLGGASSPPGYDQPLAGPSAATSPTGTSFDHTHTPAADVLDMPAPPALTHFASISSMKETATVSSVGVGGGYKPAPFPPPGLETVRPVGWADVAGGEASPTGSFGVDMSGRAAQRGTDSMIDVLEDAPPDAELGWRAMAAQAMPADMGRRGTFGTYVHGLGGIMSERGSLHSMRSHFSPSSRSTGSAPASRRDFESSIGSAVSSRPSNNARSPAGSVSHYAGASAHAQSLAHKGSLSSDDRRLGAMSPALSAFGHQARHGSSQSGSGSGSGAEPPVVPVIDAPPEARMSPEKLGGGRALRAVPSGSDDASAFLDTSFGTIRPVRSLSPLSATFPLNAPWAGGLDNDWQPSA